MVAEEAEHRIVEAHGVDRGVEVAVFHPEGGEAGHAGQAAGRAVGEVEIPEVADVQAGVQAAQDVALVQFAARHHGGQRVFVCPRAVGGQAVFGGAAGADQPFARKAVHEQAQVLARAFAGEGRGQAAVDPLMEIQQWAEP